jgi:digeranylgeranylglycerophospholipid reductase
LDERDVAIVGAGPAGASAGFFLKNGNEGLDVVMVDRLDEGKYSRYHRMCGEAISRAAFRDLAPLRPTDVVHRITKVREEWPGGKAVEAVAVGYILDRPAFLRGILGQYRSFGGEMVRDAVEKAEDNGKGTVLTLTSGRKILAKHVIAADGANSVVRRTFFRQEPPVLMWTEQHLIRRKVRDDTITFIQAEKYKGGYRWEFPAGELSRVGFPRGTDSVEAEDVVETHRRAIPMGGVNELVRNNVYLVGDAAAMPNPLTAGGIRVAMLSGKMAAKAVLKGRPLSYQSWWRSSPFSSEKFMRAFVKLKGMSDDDYERASKGFGSNPLRLAWCYLHRPEFRDLYRTYAASGLYGW